MTVTDKKFKFKKFGEGVSPFRLISNKEFGEGLKLLSDKLLSKIQKPIPGDQGKEGQSGKAGKDGKNGRDGKSGLNGKDGRDGIGKDGVNGKNGENGREGKAGKDGISVSVEDVLKELESTIEEIKREVRKKEVRKKKVQQISGGGGDSMNFQEVTTDTVIRVNAKMTLVDATSGNLTMTLPSASQGARREYHIKKVDSTENTVTISTPDGALIDGDTTLVIEGEATSCRLYSNGRNWFIL